jgi:hypothetical protein
MSRAPVVIFEASEDSDIAKTPPVRRASTAYAETLADVIRKSGINIR